MFIELHFIQNFAPSNLNRDDTGNPKDCEFGGYRRARISSQCLKRAIRLHPNFASVTQAERGERTKWLSRLIQEPLLKAGKNAEEAQTVASALAGFYASQSGKVDGKNPQKTNVLLYVSPQEAQLLGQLILDNWDELLKEAQSSKKGSLIPDLVKKQLIAPTKGRTSAPDIALFGRMLADQPELALDAACQVAHAISTHRVTMEMDYYTAVDDLLRDEEAGAGMVGFTSFNSACFYRYMVIDWKQLLQNLNHDVALARQTVAGFIQAAIAAVPSGKQNSFAAQNPPSFYLGVVRQDSQCWSLANAFETPARANAHHEQGLVANSIHKLDEYWGQLQKLNLHPDQLTTAALSLENAPLTHLAPAAVPNLAQWLQTILHALPQE